MHTCSIPALRFVPELATNAMLYLAYAAPQVTQPSVVLGYTTKILPYLGVYGDLRVCGCSGTFRSSSDI